jgi:DDE superfamily endonuclease
VEAAREALLHVVRRAPKAFGIPDSRWSLDTIHQVVDWLRTTSRASLAHLLKRLRIRYKRAREHIHSPDPDYLAKLARCATLVAAGRASDGPTVTLYLDELTYYRQPTLARAYAPEGREQATAERSQRANTPTRILGALNVADGRVHVVQRSAISVSTLVQFYQNLRAAYPHPTTLHVILDNWPVHFHPDVMVALAPQDSPFARYLPPRWPVTPSESADRRWGHLRLPIQLWPLPTYASWANPIEKLWRKLKHDRLHLHGLADDLDALRQLVLEYLTQFAQGSLALLRYVGLQPRY